MATVTEFGLLGPLLVLSDGTPVPLGRGAQRALLAALLLNAGRPVTTGQLAEVLWGAEPPPSAEASLRNHVQRLRAVLGEAGRTRIRTQPGGYLIRVDPDELDLARAEALLAAARAAARDDSWEQAAERASAGLMLWRGQPLAGIDSDALAREVPRLTEIRLQLSETVLNAEIQLGTPADAINELQRLTAAYPLREHLHALLMLALHRCGRRAEALAAYQSARRILLEELGCEPAAELTDLHQRILADSTAATASPSTVGDGEAGIVPRQLPAPVRYFVGREAELARLSGLLDEETGSTPPALVISAIGGTAGVGKTALAVEWAHQVAGRFPDGQLYVNLRGYDTDQPIAAADALARFLRALGMPSQQIPPDTEERAAAFRSLLAGRRMLIVLDNAREADQVRPLLPGGSSCAVAVTSRDALAGLVARDGAVRVDLDLLPSREAVGLLRQLIGERAVADPDAAARLATCCCRLPLALRVAAELAVARPAVPLARLVGDLADQQRRLDLLDAAGDSRTAVRAVFSWSYQHLDDTAARAFRLVSLHPGADFEVYAAAALAGSTVGQAGQLLDRLARAHLIQLAGPGRWGLHDLLRGYARELAAEHDGDQEMHRALTRLLDHYLHTAGTAMDALYPAESHRRPAIPPSATPAPPVSDAVTARAWLDAERASLVTVTAHAAGNGWPGHATRLADTLYHYVYTGGHDPEAVTIHTCARRAARQTGDRTGEARALNSLGVIDWRQGRYRQAAEHLEQALVLFGKAGDRMGEARALSNLGLVDERQGRYRQAADHFGQALVLFRETGDRIGEARALNNLGLVDERQGRYGQAADHFGQALVLFGEAGDRMGEASALRNLGDVELRQDRYPQAAGHLEQALVLFRETGFRIGEAHALGALGDLDRGQGRYPQAVSHLRQALALCHEIGDRAGETEALNGLGETLLAAGRAADASTQLATGLALASETGNRHQQARAHHGLGRAHYDLGDPGRARLHWREALILYTEIGVPEADQIRTLLAEHASPADFRR
jgi:DNA-binding SARP family transcriptional activator/Tfp pilus assembly protein PilF